MPAVRQQLPLYRDQGESTGANLYAADGEQLQAPKRFRQSTSKNHQAGAGARLRAEDPAKHRPEPRRQISAGYPPGGLCRFYVESAAACIRHGQSVKMRQISRWGIKASGLFSIHRNSSHKNQSHANDTDPYPRTLVLTLSKNSIWICFKHFSLL